MPVPDFDFVCIVGVDCWVEKNPNGVPSTLASLSQRLSGVFVATVYIVWSLEAFLRSNVGS